MQNAYFKIRKPENEQIKSYGPGSPEKESLKLKLEELKSKSIEIPLIIGGKKIYTQRTEKCIIPHNKEHVLGTYHIAGEKEIKMSIDAAVEAKKEWEKMPWEHRVSIFLKAAELLAGPWRDIINASTMLCQSKNAFQAEIDAACELIDFLRFNAYYLTEIYSDQPMSTKDFWNKLEYRPLEGFILAITPFNFTSIGGNLPTAPVMAGNVALWKPASSAVYSNYFVMELLREAGMPDGVINFIPGYGKEIGDIVLKSEDLAGIHFTGSTKVFQGLWKKIGENLNKYKVYPRLVGETGGKDFIFAHPSADSEALTTALVRGAFEYQGQKCSAASRAYIPKSVWNDMEYNLINQIASIKVGDVEDFTNFMNAVIDKKSFDKICSYIEFAKEASDAEIICGGEYDDSKGFFIQPTVIVTSDPNFKSMKEEIFGPVLTIYIYEDEDLEETLELCNSTSPYGLTGAIFSNDRKAIVHMKERLLHSAGNFYINDKPTGAVVGQQPFGGGRASGTNDKAGSKLNLLRWMNPMTIKETFNPPTDYRYNFMDEK